MECKKAVSIAIDGPAGAGKSSVAKAVAVRMGYVYIDTGAMYRTVGLYAIENGIDTHNADGLLKKALDKIDINIKTASDGQKMFLNGKDVTKQIRTPQASMAASDVATVKSVRQRLVCIQRKMAESENVIMDGRDIGSVVLPKADVKIFLTASAESRAKRRYDELCQKGEAADFEKVLCDIKYRDKNDSERKESPLKVADKAKIIDTTNMNLEESVEYVYNFIKNELEGGKGEI